MHIHNSGVIQRFWQHLYEEYLAPSLRLSSQDFLEISGLINIYTAFKSLRFYVFCMCVLCECMCYTYKTFHLEGLGKKGKL